MQIIRTEIPDVVIIEPKVFGNGGDPPSRQSAVAKKTKRRITAKAKP